VHAWRVFLAIGVLVAFGVLHGVQPPPIELADDHPMTGPPALVGPAPRTIEELKRRLAAVIETEKVPGIAIAIIGRDGPLWVGGLGVRDLETAAPVDGDTAFRVGSLSKSIIALGVMRLVDQGKLDLDAPLRTVLPRAFDNPWETIAPVTLAQCLEHTAGFDDVRFTEIFTKDEGLAVRDALAINPRSRVVRWRPGTRHAYTNVGYTLAARAIEVVTGEPFDDYIRREILAPMGIADADFRRTSTLAPRLATGYQGGIATAFHPFAHRPSGSLLASAGDLGKLVAFLIKRGEGYPPIVSREGLARIERNGTLPYPPLAADYGLANYGDVWHPVLSRGHDGGMPGFHASFRYFPELGVGYAMLLNSDYTFQGYRNIRQLLFGYLTQGKAFPPPPEAAPHEATPAADYFGFEAPRHALFAFVERATNGWFATRLGDRVRLDELRGDSARLIPTADGGYRFPWEYGSSVRFVELDDGTPAMVMGFSYGEADSGTYAWFRYRGLGLVMVLLYLAPLWAAGMLLHGVIRRRHVLPLSLVLWPAIAGLAFLAMPYALFRSFEDGVIGEVHPLTLAFCGLTILLAAGSTVTFLSSLRWLRRPDRAPWSWRLFPTVCGVAFFSFTLWLAAHGLIGVRTWAW
jgi:CubicO group peptidase (beta-lactamase class C family)